MSHELDMSNGKANMAYSGAVPWHGLGQQIVGLATIDEWKAAAGLNWTIEGSPVYYIPRGPDHPIPADVTRQVLFRSDTKAPLSVVGDDYRTVQPGEILEFFRSLTESAGFQMETAGSLYGGRKIWGLARIGPDAAVAKKDKVGGFLLLTTSCDGTMATTAKFTTVRVVCRNTLHVALPGAEDSVRVPHSTNFNHDKVKAELGVGVGAFESFMQKARSLAKVKLDDVKAMHVLREGMADAIDAEYAEMDSEKFGKLPTVQRIMKLYSGEQIGFDIGTVKGTAWGLVNACTEFYDHHVRAASVDNRMQSAWFGKGNFVKTCVFDQACELID